MKSTRANIKLALTVFMLFTLVTLCVYGMYNANKPKIVNIENTFADVNGDGVLDIIVSGKVIINEAQSNL